ncbi:MAG: TetR/AcrR family transcriptional regulator [Mycobacteriaceae bacterium]
MDEADPRRERSRTRLVDAATRLLAGGGVEAVTIDAVTKTAKVARATLYRHFNTGNELVAAAFGRLIPPATELTEVGTLDERLLQLVAHQARLINEAPMNVTALCWMGLGPDLGDALTAERPELNSLRLRVAETYRAPFQRILQSEQAIAEIGEVDLALALAQLLGPVVFTRLATVTPLDEHACKSIVDNYLFVHRKRFSEKFLSEK